MHIYIYVCMYIYIYTYIRTDIYIYIYMYILNIYICACVCGYVREHNVCSVASKPSQSSSRRVSSFKDLSAPLNN